MQRFCPCGKKISGRTHLCQECLGIYGTSPSEWPKWLVYSVSDLRRQYREDSIYEAEAVDIDWDEDEDGFIEYLDDLYPFDHLIGCRTETHLYEDSDKYPPSEGLINSHKK